MSKSSEKQMELRREDVSLTADAGPVLNIKGLKGAWGTSLDGVAEDGLG